MRRLSREWRRFRDRRLKPFVRRLLGDDPAPAAGVMPPPPPEPPSIEPLVVALLRSELRRRAAFGCPPPDFAALARAWHPDGTAPTPVETLVTALLASRDPVADDAA